MCHFGPFRDIFGGNSFSEISDDFYALKLLFLPFFDQTIRNSQKMSIAVFQLFERNHYVPKALWLHQNKAPSIGQTSHWGTIV